MSISPLRQRMIDDMTARNFGEKAQKDYIRCVKNFAAFLGRSPETADLEDLRRFRLHLIESSLGVPSVNTAMQALRFFFSVTLDKPLGSRSFTSNAMFVPVNGPWLSPCWANDERAPGQRTGNAPTTVHDRRRRPNRGRYDFRHADDCSNHSGDAHEGIPHSVHT